MSGASGCRDCGGPKPSPRHWYCEPCGDGRQARSALDRTYRSLYGIGVDDYEKLLGAQDGRCAICGKTPQRPPGKRNRHRPAPRLAVDHDHTTGEVRGLLCTFCNRYLVPRQMTALLLAQAAEYLADPPAQYVLRDTR